MFKLTKREIRKKLTHITKGETRNEQSLEIFKKNVETYLFRITYYNFM
jgi:hypothetical protein